MENKSFFRNVNNGEMSLGSIFSEVGKRHTSEQKARVFIGGTELTTPKEKDMLAVWQKPYLFAEFFGICFGLLLVLYLITIIMGQPAGAYNLLVLLPFVVPVTLLILVWEMHIPRTISLLEVIKVAGIGGILSITITLLMGIMFPDVSTRWIGLIEEPAKMIIVYYLLKKKDRKYILDGILLGVAVGTGFGMFESLMYVLDQFMEVIIELCDAMTLGVIGAGDLYMTAIYSSLQVALMRAINSISGHGIYAGLYAGGFMIAKGKEPASFRHFFSFSFIEYFAIAVGIHAVNNSGNVFGLPVWQKGLLTIRTDLVILTIVGVAVFLSLLRKGVNEVVKACTQLNGDRLTYAVERKGKEAVPVASRNGFVQLEGSAGLLSGQNYRIESGEKKTIGRIPGKNDIVISQSQKVSSVHCQIWVREKQVYVRDLNSTNGTYIEEQKIMPNQDVPIANGQTIYLGNKNCGFKVRTWMQ